MGFPSKNTGVACHFPLQGILPDQGSNLHLLCWQRDSLPLNHQGSPNTGLCVCVCMCVLVAQSCPTLSTPGFSVHGILQARILGWVVICFSGGSSQLQDWFQVCHTAGRFLTIWATREAIQAYQLLKLLFLCHKYIHPFVWVIGVNS